MKGFFLVSGLPSTLLLAPSLTLITRMDRLSYLCQFEEWRREEANSQHYIPFRPIILTETWTASDKSFFSWAVFLGKRRPTYKGFRLKLIGPSLESSQVSAAAVI